MAGRAFPRRFAPNSATLATPAPQVPVLRNTNHTDSCFTQHQSNRWCTDAVSVVRGQKPGDSSDDPHTEHVATLGEGRLLPGILSLALRSLDRDGRVTPVAEIVR